MIETPVQRFGLAVKRRDELAPTAPFLERAANTWRGLFPASRTPIADGLLATANLAPDEARTLRRRNSFKMSEVNRLTAEWVATLLNPDDEIRFSNRRMRARARDLERNDPYARQFLNLLAVNVVGYTGPTLRAKIANNDGKPAKAINDKIEAGWAEWCESPMVDRRMSFASYSRLALRTVGRDGESLTRIHTGFKGNRFRFALQGIDADQLDEMINRPKKDGKTEIRMGVEVDDWGGPSAYHLYDRPETFFGSASSGKREPERVAAGEVIHLYDSLRIGQTRGITWFHPIAVALKMLGGYSEAELVAARTAAAKMGWFQRQKGENATGAELNTDPETNAFMMEANPGSIEFAPDGYEFSAWDPQHPTGAFAAFVKAKLREIATGLGVSYNALANDLEGVNYSSIRSGLLIERDIWRALQTWWIGQFTMRVFREWLNASLLSGALVLDTRDARKFYAVKFSPRGWAWVDPLKDAQAGLLAIQSGLSSRQMLLDEQGVDFEDVVEDLKLENEMAAEAGVDISGPKAAAAPADDEGDDDETGDDSKKKKKADDDEDRTARNRVAALSSGGLNGHGA